MNIWRLVAHDKQPDEAIRIMKSTNRIAIGWTDIGDLNQVSPQNSTDITKLIQKSYRNITNANFGGPSLWNFYNEVNEGDFVILTSNSKRNCVFEIAGPYFFATSSNDICGYLHQRIAYLTDIDPNLLWESANGEFKQGQNSRWALASIKNSKSSKDIILKEGKRYSVTSTLIERNSIARQKCIEHFGALCQVCGINFKDTYGKLGEGFIHIHHKVDISIQPEQYEVNPITDLIPLCPNCHAMVHKKKPAMSIEELKQIYIAQQNT